MSPKQCPRAECEGKMYPSEYVATRKVAGRIFKIPVESWVCEVCGKETITYQEARKVTLHIAADLAQNGPLTGAAFRQMRKAMKLSAKEIAKLLGLSPETVSRWEQGHRKADPRSVALLGVIMLEYLENDGQSRTRDRVATLVA